MAQAVRRMWVGLGSLHQRQVYCIIQVDDQLAFYGFPTALKPVLFAPSPPSIGKRKSKKKIN